MAETPYIIGEMVRLEREACLDTAAGAGSLGDTSAISLRESGLDYTVAAEDVALAHTL